MKIITRGAVIRLAAIGAVIFIFIFLGCCSMTKFGKSYKGALPELSGEQLRLREELRRDVEMLAGQIGERNTFHYAKLNEAADYIEQALIECGLKVRRQGFWADGEQCYNLEAEITGLKYPEKIIIVGAHYDSVYGSAGANDNGSGVAAAMALARRFLGNNAACTIRFVFFANEEPPFYQTEQMGSLVYARECKSKKENIIAMLSLETIGYYTDKRGSQKYPIPFSLFYPSTGNFLGFVSNTRNRGLLKQVVGSFRRHCQFPSQAGAIPEFVPGIGWSDHWAFWQQGYAAIMITDTAPFRYPHYHQPSDTSDKLDYTRLAIVVTGLESVLKDLANNRVWGRYF